MLKILFIVGLPELGGSNRSLLSLIKGLIDKGHNVNVVMSKKGDLSRMLDELKVYNTVIYHRPALYPDCENLKDLFIYIPRLIYTLSSNTLAYIRLKKIVKSTEPDIIHTNISCINIGYFVARDLNIAHVWHVREYNKLDFNRIPIPTINYLRHRLQNSNPIYITKQIAHYYTGSDYSNVIYNGIKQSTEYKHVNKKEPYFLHVGGITANKGVEVTIRSFAKFINKHSGYKLFLVGGCRNNYRFYLDKIIMELGISESVVFLGVIDNVYDYMSSAVALIVSSYNEAFGRITAEAMSSRCIVIGRNTAGTKEQFDNGVEFTGREIGLRFSDNDELIYRMEEILKLSDEDIERIKIDAFNTVKKLYSLEEYVKKIEDYYMKVKRCYNAEK